MADLLDARGLKCPLPVLMMEKRLAQSRGDGELVVLATDPIAKIDIPLFCRQRGYACVMTLADGVMRFAIVKSQSDAEGA